MNVHGMRQLRAAGMATALIAVLFTGACQFCGLTPDRLDDSDWDGEMWSIKSLWSSEAPPAPTMHNFAKEVTQLENDIREYGSITIKEPDVWGETNLMFFIQEY